MQYLDKSFFNAEMQKIIDQFGTKIYGPDRIKIIYQDLKTLKPKQFRDIVQGFLVRSRYAPLPVDFWEAAGNYMDQNRQDQKQKETKVYSSMFDDAEKSRIFKVIGSNDEKQVSKLVNFLDKVNKSKCRECNDTGLVSAKPVEKDFMADVIFNCCCDLSSGNKLFDKWSGYWKKFYLNNNHRKI